MRTLIVLVAAAVLTSCGVPGYSSSQYAELVRYCERVVANPAGCTDVVDLVEQWRCPVRDAYGLIDILGEGRIPSEEERSVCPAATPPVAPTTTCQDTG